MAKTRVHQLAKELGIDSKIIMEEAEKHGISIKNHMSALADTDEMMLRAFLESRPAAVAPAAPPGRDTHGTAPGAGASGVAAPTSFSSEDLELDTEPETVVEPELEPARPEIHVAPRVAAESVTARVPAPPFGATGATGTTGTTPTTPSTPATTTTAPAPAPREPRAPAARVAEGVPAAPPAPPVSPAAPVPAETAREVRVVRVVRPGAAPSAPSAPSAPAASPAAPAAGAPVRHAAPPASAPIREVAARRVTGPQQPPERTASAPGDQAAPPAPAAPAPSPVTAEPPRVVRAVPSATAVPPRAADAHKPLREAPPPRRQAEILGRKELPPPRPPRTGGQDTGGGRGSGFSARGSASSPGSGLIATRSEGGKRTFVVTGRGRGAAGARPSGPGGPGGARGRPVTTMAPGAGPGRDRGERSFHKPRQSDQHIVAPSQLTIQMPTTVKGLSESMGVKANVLIQRLFLNHKKMVKMNDPLDKDTVELLGIEFDCEITCVEKADVETSVIDQIEKDYEADAADRVARPPIVTFLGHVDHGKTSLLDAIRQTNVAAKEHGGITQHIGATRVALPDGRSVVFLDTPGHRAFTEMRSRGAQVTDVVVLVVAADDGVMPQTKEAIAHARAADVPIVVALNKIDKPEANVMRVRQELAGEGLMDEKWGGKTMFVETSATTKKGIPELIESLLLEAEVLELKANPDRPAVATVLEAAQSGGEGNAARLLVNDGTLKKGDIFVCGTAYGRVRAIKSPDGSFIPKAGPSWPVEITGLNELPRAGDKFHVLEDLEQAREIAARRTHLIREKEIAKASHVSLENLFEKLKGASLKIILKVDVTGSLEVLQREISALVHPEIRPEIIHAAVGGITETDVTLADASDAVILGFHVSADMGARNLAEQLGVEIRIYHVIYKLIEDLTSALEGRLKPEIREVLTGEAEVRRVWKVSRIGTIAGCFVQSGIFKRSSKIRISRGGIVTLPEGQLDSLKRVKDDVREVKEGLECGMVIKGFEAIEVGDVITAFEMETVKRTFGG